MVVVMLVTNTVQSLITMEVAVPVSMDLDYLVEDAMPVLVSSEA